MRCPDVVPRIRDYLDRELDLAEAQGVEAHLAACPDCAHRCASERDLKRVLGARLRVDPAPAGLAHQVLRLVRDEAARHRVRHRRVMGAVPAIAAVVLVAALVAWPSTARPVSRLATELVDDHIRYLTVTKPGELVPSSRAEAVRWFEGRLDVAVDLPVIADPAFELRGARLCYVLDRRVALLFYEYCGSRLSLFAMRESGLVPDEMVPGAVGVEDCPMEAFKGYQVACWSRAGVLYALVSEERIGDEVARIVGAGFSGARR